MLFISVVTKTQRILFNVAIFIYGYLESRMDNCSVKGIHNIWKMIGSLSFASVTKTFLALKHLQHGNPIKRLSF